MHVMHDKNQTLKIKTQTAEISKKNWQHKISTTKNETL